jgi:hypothetical protein
MKLSITFTLIILFSIIGCQQEKNLLPNEFFDLKLDKKLTGKRAIEFVNKLHFNPVTSEKNEIGFYSSSKGTAIIYITYYKNREQARRNYIKMTEKISPQNSVFIQGKTFELNGRIIYQTFGMGQTHFVFISSEKLFWVSLETIWAKSFLTSYLDFIE